jgi:uncharacterized protein YndB with AHSA1/START domain
MVVFVVGGLVIVIITVLVIGTLLPEAHEASGTARLASPPEQVFDVLVDVDRYPEWRSDVTSVEITGKNPLRWRERSGGDTITLEVIEHSPPERLRVRIADPDLPFGGTWTYALARDDGGTRVTITEHGEVYNPVFRFVSRFVIGHDATIQTFLTDLRRRLE